jgi:predicted Rossmann fold nucleotide-binding protein DprA/Smf involved in DNA uptake
MEYKIVEKNNPQYPQKLIDRLKQDAPERVYCFGPLELLDQFTMGVISADSISGIGMMAANQLLFTIREYSINYIGSWFSVMETEIFRLGLWRANQNVTLFSSKGLAKETFESYLKARFYPPMHEFPEREEYFRRAKENELLMLSIVDPDVRKMIRKNIIERNFIACMLSDVVFIPFAEKRTKTLAMAKRLASTEVPLFTTDCEENRQLHKLGIPGLGRQDVGNYLENLGAKLSDLNIKRKKNNNPASSAPDHEKPPKKSTMSQIKLWQN